jgi:hypothetical protein
MHIKSKRVCIVANHALENLYTVLENGSWGSSVSIASGYGLDDRVIGVRSLAGAENFSSSLYVHTGSDAHPAFCTMGTGGPFPGVKRGWGMTLTAHPHLVPRSRISRSYTSSSPKRLHGMWQDCFTLLENTFPLSLLQPTVCQFLLQL